MRNKTSFTSLRDLALTCLAAVGLAAPLRGQQPDSTSETPVALVPGTIILKADAPEGVKLHGKAKLGGLSGKTEDIRATGMAGERLILLGTWSRPNPEENRVEFAPTLPKGGLYDVYVRWYSLGFGGGNTKGLPIRVEFDGGQRDFTVDMNRGNVWMFLGRFPFQAGSHGKIVADARGTQGGSNMNGVKFIPVDALTPVSTPGERVLPILPGEQDAFDRLRVRAAKNFTPSVDADLSDPRIAEFVNQSEASAYLDWITLRKEEGVTDLWTDLPTRRAIEKNEGGGWELRFSFERISGLAAAYVGGNEALGFAEKTRGNPELLADILYSLDWMYRNRYNERSKNKLGADWINMEIIIPSHVARTLLLLHDKVPNDLREKLLLAITTQSPGPDRMYGGGGTGNPTGFPSTGFNRLFGVNAFALRSVVTKDGEAMERIPSLIEEEYQLNKRSNPIVRGGKKGKPGFDGYYSDGSFIQHNDFPYIGIYGRGMLGEYAKLQSFLADSPWAIDDPRAEIFFDWVYHGYAPLFFGGEIMYGSLGRSTGQSWHQNGAVSSEILDALVRLAADAPAEHKARLSSILKTWIVEKENSAYPEFSIMEMQRFSPESYGALMEIKNDPSIPLASPPPGTTVFHNTDYVVHHQPDYAVQLRMFSTRIKTHEDINEGTNRLGWYQGEATLFLYNRDNSRYNDHFWATVNPYRLPGITVDPRPRETPGSKDGQYSRSPWAGGVGLDGFGLASMGLAAVEASLTAQKAWFFFGDQIVALGNEIKSTDDRPIETIVENAKLHDGGEYAFVVNGEAQPSTPGWTADLRDVRWANLAGNVPGTDIGWVFPGGAELKGLRESRTGSWRESFVKDHNNSEHTRNFLTLWYDHGANPAGATYAYILLPGRDAAATKAYADSPGVDILENSAKAQTVKSADLGVTGANFWTADPYTSGGISSSGKAAVLVVEKEGTLQIAVADPTQLEASVEITLQGAASKAIQVGEGMKVLSLSPLTLAVNLEKSDGRSFVAEFRK